MKKWKNWKKAKTTEDINEFDEFGEVEEMEESEGSEMSEESNENDEPEELGEMEVVEEVEEVNNTSIYTPLDPTRSQIRLIYLQPLSSGDEISCSLHIASLDDTTCVYEALSYEWAPEAPSRWNWTSVRIWGTGVINLNGRDFPVRKNLWNALYHLRNKGTIRIIWVDALAINQGDDVERGHQVQQMNRIYKRCSQVIAWVGPDCVKLDSRWKTEFEYIVKCLGQYTKPCTYKQNTTAILNSEFLGKVEVDVLPSKFLETKCNCGLRSHVLHFMRNSYWQRLWIIQEFVLAPKIVICCEGFCLSWEQMEAFNEHVTRGTLFVKEYNSLMDTRKKIEQQDRSLLQLVNSHIDSKCSVLHDHVYGLLGLAPSCCRESIIVDYSSSIAAVLKQIIMHHETSHCHNIEDNVWHQRDCMKLLHPRILNWSPNESVPLDRVRSATCFIKMNLYSCGKISSLLPLTDIDSGFELRTGSRGQRFLTSQQTEGEILDDAKIGDMVFVLGRGPKWSGDVEWNYHCRMGFILENRSSRSNTFPGNLSTIIVKPFLVDAMHPGESRNEKPEALFIDFDNFHKLSNLIELVDELHFAMSLIA